MSEPVLRAMRLSVEMWDRVNMVGCVTDDGTVSYHRKVESIAVNVNGGSQQLFLETLAPQEIEVLLPMVDALSLALRERKLIHEGKLPERGEDAEAAAPVVE